MGEYETTMRERRRHKEEHFRDHPHSPLPPDEQERFEGLSYYPPDPDYRFECELHEHEDKERITAETTADGEQEYIRHGEFRVALDGQEVVLQAYRPVSDEDRLWVPFRDTTSGGETYGAGRYLDLDPDRHQTGTGTWLLDFNEAYNPTCAYNEAYECPLPPTENWLEVPIEAGEKDYH